jgi:ADP-ribose pyrophosphatase YjhB (NUDIX family)
MRNKFLVAVHMFFIQNGHVLLLRRYNTGYQDGQYSVVAGHVEAGETVTEAAVREAFEEAGVVLDYHDVQVVHVMNRKSEDERIDFFVNVESWMGEIINKEPQKCDHLAWFPVNSLPENMIPYVKHALEQSQGEIYYSEFGW